MFVSIAPPAKHATGQEFCEIFSAEAATATGYSSGQAIAGAASGVAVSVVGHCLPETWRREAEQMGGDPIPGPHDILRLWYQVHTLKGKERAEAIAKLEEWFRRININMKH